MMSGDVRFGSAEFQQALSERFDGDTVEVLRLAAHLCTMPGVSVPAHETAFGPLARTCTLVQAYAEGRGLRVHVLEPDDEHPYPFLIVGFTGNDLADPDFSEAVALIGHLDVVPAKSESQFSPFLRGVDLHARGVADMKTVVSTYLVWMARLQQHPGPKPPMLLLLSTCEENGSHRPHHVRSAVEWLRREHGVIVRFGLVGERTGELEWMGEDLPVGPVCAENRSWRWLNWSSTSVGLPALARVAGLVKRCRETVAELNSGLSGHHDEQQPGLRSGILNPFTLIAGARRPHGPASSIAVIATCSGGSAVHSAVADATRPSLVERFHTLVAGAVSRFGRENLDLAGVAIGEQGNFNTWDGSGEMQLLVIRAPLHQVHVWAAETAPEGISLTVSEKAVPVRGGPTLAGLDIRELLAHREAINELLTRVVGEGLVEGEALESIHDLPAWRCPAGQSDLTALLAAYEAVVGEPSPDLVKLHGNDGGSLVASQQAADPALAVRGEGRAVIFGQVGSNPHGPREFHRGTSIRPYLEILDRWAATYLQSTS